MGRLDITTFLELDGSAGGAANVAALYLDLVRERCRLADDRILCGCQQWKKIGRLRRHCGNT